MNGLSDFQMTLSLVKNSIYYSAIIQDWAALVHLINMNKGDMIDMAGAFIKLMKKSNADGYMRFAIKINPNEIKIGGGNHLTLNTNIGNTGSNKLLLLKHVFVNIRNQEEISTSTQADAITEELQVGVFDACKYTKYDKSEIDLM